MLELAPWNFRHVALSSAPGHGGRHLPDAAGLSRPARSRAPSSTATPTLSSALSAQGVTGSGTAVGDAASSLDLRLTVPARAPHDDHDPLVSVSVHLADAELPQAPPPFAQRSTRFPLRRRCADRYRPPALAIALARGAMTAARSTSRARTSLGTNPRRPRRAHAGARRRDAARRRAHRDYRRRRQDHRRRRGGRRLEPRYAAVAKSVLRAVAEPNNDGGETLHVPLSLQDRRLYVGPAPVAALRHSRGARAARRAAHA